VQELAGCHLPKGRVLRREQRSPRSLTQYAEDADGADGGDGVDDDFPAKEEKGKSIKFDTSRRPRKWGKRMMPVKLIGGKEILV
jgi:hypothetical protein